MTVHALLLDELLARHFLQRQRGVYGVQASEGESRKVGSKRAAVLSAEMV